MEITKKHTRQRFCDIYEWKSHITFDYDAIKVISSKFKHYTNYMLRNEKAIIDLKFPSFDNMSVKPRKNSIVGFRLFVYNNESLAEMLYYDFSAYLEGMIERYDLWIEN